MKKKNFMTMILATTLAIGAGVMSGCSKKSGWESGASQTSESVQAKNNMTITGQNGAIQMLSVLIDPNEYEAYNVSDSAESAHLVTASYPTGEYVSNPAVDWIVEFVDAEKAWATGKKASDYVTVTPTSDGALTAVVECKQEFGAQIRVTCASRQTPDLTASFTCDYKSFVESIALSFQCLSGDDLDTSSAANEPIVLTAMPFLDTEEDGTQIGLKEVDISELHAEGRHFIEFEENAYTLGTTKAENVTYKVYVGMGCYNAFTAAVQESEVLSLCTDYNIYVENGTTIAPMVEMTDIPVNLALPGLQYLALDDQYAIAYYWAAQEYGAEVPSEYVDKRAKFTEYMQIMQEMIELVKTESGDEDVYLHQYVLIESSDTVREYYDAGLGQIGVNNISLNYELGIYYTNPSEYFVAEATTLTLDTENILFEP